MTAQAPEDEDLLETARERPEESDVDTLVSILEWDDNQARNVALMALAHVAADDPSRVVEHTDDVIERLDDEFPVAQTSATQVLAKIAPEYPEAVEPALPQLVEKLTQMPPLNGYRAGRAMAPILRENPEAFLPYTDDLIDVVEEPPSPGIPSAEELKEMPNEKRKKIEETLEDRTDEARADIFRCYGIQEIAAHALVEISEIEPEAIADRTEDLRPGLTAEPSVVTAATLDVLANVGQEDLAAVEPLLEDVLDLLWDTPTNVRVHAVQTLGFVGVTEAVEPLRELAESDAPEVTEDLAELAEETADFLEAQD